MKVLILPQDVGADSTIQNKEGMTAVDVAPISVLHVFKKDVAFMAKVPPLEEQQESYSRSRTIHFKFYTVRHSTLIPIFC